MKKKIELPKYFICAKDFNSGELEKYDILEGIFKNILTPGGKINTKQFSFTDFDSDKPTVKSVTTREDLVKYLRDEFMYRYWSKCEWEYIIVDWPYKSNGLIEDSRPIKVDAFQQIELNFDVIVDLVWNVVSDKLVKNK